MGEFQNPGCIQHSLDARRGPLSAQNDDAEWTGDGKLIHVKCDYRLVIDNLMDPTHETFVHGASIGDRAVAEAPFVATHGDRFASVTRWMDGITPPPYWAGQIRHARDCVVRIDDLLAPSTLSDTAFSAHADLNARFHQLLAEAAGSGLVRRQIERIVSLPFASPNAFVMLRATGPGSQQARDSLVVAQQQHRAVIEAITQREGARAESLMREHARIADTNLRAALVTPHGRQQLPGAKLIRHAGAIAA